MEQMFICMGRCPESAHSQETVPCTTGLEGRHPSRPAGSNPHISPQQLGPMGCCPESTSSTSQGIWSSFSRGMECLSRTVGRVAPQVTARWTASGGAPVRGVAVPLGRSNPPPEQLMPQGAEFRWMPAPDEIELPDATALNPAVCHYIRTLNPRTSPGSSAVAAPFIKHAEKRVPAVNGRGTERINVLVPYVARLFAAMIEKAEIPTCWKAAKLTQEGISARPCKFSHACRE
eukprot:1141078-Pelagomonas_calceolata.AAC.2